MGLDGTSLALLRPVFHPPTARKQPKLHGPAAPSCFARTQAAVLGWTVLERIHGAALPPLGADGKQEEMTMAMRRTLQTVCLCACGWAALSCTRPWAEGAPSPLRHERITHQGMAYDVIWVNVRRTPLRLFWKRPDGQPFQNFTNLAAWLKAQHQQLLFATNAGIYARDHTPLGLHVENGETFHALNRYHGGGNFFLKPNGVLYVDKEGAGILETEAYAKSGRKPILAIQSGPLLLSQGKMHPDFHAESDSKFIRNGVGVASPDTVVFAISCGPVNFHAFACFFGEKLGCKDALYLDGAISGMYAPFAGRNDTGLDYVGILAVAVPEG